MRALIPVGVIGLGLVWSPVSKAQSSSDYPLCAPNIGGGGKLACYYKTWEQCMAAHAERYTCVSNPNYRGPQRPTPSAARPKKRSK